MDSLCWCTWSTCLSINHLLLQQYWCNWTIVFLPPFLFIVTATKSLTILMSAVMNFDLYCDDRSDWNHWNSPSVCLFGCEILKSSPFWPAECFAVSLFLIQCLKKELFPVDDDDDRGKIQFPNIARVKSNQSKPYSTFHTFKIYICFYIEFNLLRSKSCCCCNRLILLYKSSWLFPLFFSYYHTTWMDSPCKTDGALVSLLLLLFDQMRISLSARMHFNHAGSMSRIWQDEMPSSVLAYI